MALYTGTIALADVATWHAKLRDGLEAAATTDTNWDVTESGYSDGTYVRSVFKCLGAKTFYVIIFHVVSPTGSSGGTTQNSHVYLTMCEDYDAATHELKRPARYNSGVLAAATDNSVSTSWLTLSSAFDTHGAARFIPVSANGTWGSGYRVALANDFFGVVLQTRTGTATSVTWRNQFLAAAMTSVVTDASTNDSACFGGYALYGTPVAWNGGSISNLSGSVPLGVAGMTRNPFASGQGSFSWNMEAHAWHNYSGLMINSNDRFAGATSGRRVSPVALRRATTADGNDFGIVRCRVPRSVCTIEAYGVAGDTITIGSTTYERWASAYGGIWIEVS